MGRVVRIGEGLRAAGQEIEVVGFVTGGGRDRMIPLRNQHRLIIARHNGLIQTPVAGINALDCVTLRRIYFVKINFLQVRFQQPAGGIHSMDVVLVRRIRAPVPCGGIDFHRHETLARKSRRENRVNLARSISATPNLDGHVFWRDQARRIPSLRRSPTVSQIDLIALRFNPETGFRRQIKSVRHSGKHICSPPYDRPIPS